MKTFQQTEAPPSPGEWRALVAPYQRPALRRSFWQPASTVGPCLALWYLLLPSLASPYWLALAGGLLLRSFIIFHDCGHGSFT